MQRASGREPLLLGGGVDRPQGEEAPDSPRRRCCRVTGRAAASGCCLAFTLWERGKRASTRSPAQITIGVAHKGMQRKTSDDLSRLGHNALSWSVYWSGTGFSFWHKGQEKMLGSPKARRVGVYLDQHAGLLSFYRISNNQAQLIHRHQGQFSGPLHPGFRFWSAGEAVTICQLD